MVDIAALMSTLPVSGLEPQWVASIGGFVDVPKDRDWQERIWLLEPPAGQHVPYIEPLEVLEQLLCRQGVAPEDAPAQARGAVARMKEDFAAPSGPSPTRQRLATRPLEASFAPCTGDRRGEA